MEVTAQLSEFVRVHGHRIADLWLERIEPSFGAEQQELRHELRRAMQRCLARVADVLAGPSDGTTTTLESGPVFDPCVALLGYDVLIDAIQGAPRGSIPELVGSDAMAAASALAQAISAHVALGSDQQRAAYRLLQSRLAEAFHRRALAERRAALLAQAVEHMPAGLGIADASGRMLLSNPELERLLGEEPPPNGGSPEPGPKATGNGAPDAEARPFARLLRQRQRVDRELVELERPSRPRALLEISAAPVTTAKHATVVVAQDVTERQRQIHELQQLWELARDLLCVIGSDTYFRRVNPAFTRVLGHSQEELLTTSLLEFVHPDDCPATVLEMRKSEQGVPMVQFENRYRCRDGSYKWLAWSATPVPGERVAYAVARDVSDERRFGEAQALLTRFGSLVASCLDYESTLANVARVVVPALADWCLIDVVGPDGKLSCVEAACADSTRAGLIPRLRAVTAKRPEHPALRALKSGRVSAISDVTPERLRLIANDPKHLELLTLLGARSVVSAPLQARGQVLGVLTLITAESGRRYGAEDLMLLRDLSRRAGQALDNARLFSEAREHVAFEQRVVAVVSHDLRNPLTAIAMVVSRMLHEQRDSKQEQQLQIMQRAVHRALGLVSDLLDVAKARVSGGIPLHPAPADLRQIVLEVVEEARASHPSRRIELQAEGDLRGTWDLDRMAQVATNLIVNALTYGDPDGSVSVALREVGEEVELAVKNYGKPIPAQAHAPLFDAMRRGAHAPKDSAGLGLGLFIAKQIVLAHHGTIAVRSSDADGTIFTVRLPRSPPRDPDGAVDLSEPPRPRAP